MKKKQANESKKLLNKSAIRIRKTKSILIRQALLRKIMSLNHRVLSKLSNLIRQPSQTRRPLVANVLAGLMVVLVISTATVGLTAADGANLIRPSLMNKPTEQNLASIEPTASETAAATPETQESIALSLPEEFDSLDSQSVGRSMDMMTLLEEQRYAESLNLVTPPAATAAPTVAPTATPTAKPTAKPTPKPTAKPTPKPTPKPTATPVATPVSAGSPLTAAQQHAIIDLAKAQLGKRYVYGAMSPSNGFDCSGFTAYIYQTLFKIYLPHSANDQSKRGISVAKTNMQVGDIICFDWSSPRGVCDHVGIYIGGGQYINASRSAGKVVQAPVNLSNPIMSVRRIVH